MELLQLRYFATVARLENITRAAAFHRIPQSAMSKTISKLERELDIPLFTREKNQLALTEEGRTLYQGVKNALGSLDQALQTVLESKAGSELHGEVKCLFLQHRYNLADCVVAFQRLHPHVRFNIQHALKDMADFDLCVSSYFPLGPEYVGIPLLEEALMVAVSAAHPLAGRPAVRLEELRQEKFLFLSPDSSILRILVTHCAKYGFHPHIVTYVDDLRCLEKYVACNLGIAIVPSISWKQLSFHGSVLLPIDEASFQRKTFLFQNDLKPMNRTANAFFRYLELNFKETLEQAAKLV